MKIQILNDIEDFDREIGNKQYNRVFADIKKEFGIIIFDDETTIVFKLFDKSSSSPLAKIESFLNGIKSKIFSNVENKHIVFLDMKDSIGVMSVPYNKSFYDLRISSTLKNRKADLSAINKLDNYCDFTTFVESRAKIFKSVRDYVFSDEIAGKSDIAQILYDATDSYIEMERKGFLFDEKILPNLNNQDIRGNRIYFSYDLTGTVTGRTFSKIHPLPKDVKRHIYPDKNKVFVNFDYNAGEARILSHYSEDENLLDIFNNDQDLHKINAAVIFDRKNEEEVGTQERSVAKLVFFSIINGVSVSTLSKDLKRYKIDTDMTHKIKTAMQKVYSKSTSWISKLQSEAIQKKYVMNLFGRIRYLEDDIRIDESRAKKQASNAIIQSTLSDFKLVALGDIHKKYPGIMVAEFHDAILVELELNDGINAIIKDIIGIMSGIGDRYKLKCPLKASFEVRKYL